MEFFSINCLHFYLVLFLKRWRLEKNENLIPIKFGSMKVNKKKNQYPKISFESKTINQYPVGSIRR